MATITQDIVKGSIAGLIGIMAHAGTAQFMWDWTKRTNPEAIKREQEIEPKDPFPILADKLGSLIGVTPTEKQERQFEQYVTVGLGAGMGALYAIAARRWPLDWLTGGITFGTLFWAIEDEAMGPAMGLAGDNTQYPMEAHIRGWAAHVAFGIVTAAVARSMGVRSGSRPAGATRSHAGRTE
ncbi:MAG TPA: hypothetical protein VJ692_07825 [Nitrospiraceae bacterium]|nr:hypothetical protein [Nitrospiraceae bacterium]